MATRSSVGMMAGCGGVVIGFPVLYAGVFYGVLPLTIIGFIIFAVGILIEPALRFIPQRPSQNKPPPGGPSAVAGASNDSVNS